LYGFDVVVLKRGYKAFRNYALQSFKEPRKIIVLGGKTGSGKTKVLHKLEKLGEVIIDLEGLAHHKGSAFGTIGENDNCSQEHFENKLAMAWTRVDKSGRIWIEDESRSIGKKILPEAVWNQLRSSHVINLEVPIENRINFLVSEYGRYPKEELLEATLKIKTRLGGLAYKQIVEAIDNNDLAIAAEILLVYYDKGYKHGIEKRDPETIHNFKTEEKEFSKIAEVLLNFCKEIPNGKVQNFKV
jgi:tRNA 2-selenouridine synthase